VSQPTEPGASPPPTEPASTDPLARHYFVDDGRGVIGPITGEKLKEMIENGAVPRAANLNLLGAPNWVPALDFPPFAGFYKSAPPPPTQDDVFAQKRPQQQQQQPRASQRPKVPASFWTRLLAYLLDALILAAAQIVLGMAIGLLAFASYGPEAAKEAFEQHQLLLNGLAVLLILFYEVHFVSSPRQATPGKIIMGIRIVRRDGARLSPLFALGRYLARVLAILPLGFGVLAIFWSKDRQGLHDMLCDTFVVEGEL